MQVTAVAQGVDLHRRKAQLAPEVGPRVRASRDGRGVADENGTALRLLKRRSPDSGECGPLSRHEAIDGLAQNR